MRANVGEQDRLPLNLPANSSNFKETAITLENTPTKTPQTPRSGGCGGRPYERNLPLSSHDVGEKGGHHTALVRGCEQVRDSSTDWVNVRCQDSGVLLQMGEFIRVAHHKKMLHLTRVGFKDHHRMDVPIRRADHEIILPVQAADFKNLTR